MRAFDLLFHLITLPDTINAINCLVMRHRHGLTSEECPPAAVGCRIKVLSNKIVWYPVSKMYDRNQMVCVYPLEYEGTAGCVPKPSGDIRCWCHNVSDCNDEITSAQLLNAFLTSNTKKMQAIVKRLETGKRVDYDVIDDETQSTTTATTMETTTTITTLVTNTTAITNPTSPTTTTMSTTTSSSTAYLTTVPPITFMNEDIYNDLEPKVLPTSSEIGRDFEETRQKLIEEMQEGDERLRQLLIDEEAVLRKDDEESKDDDYEEERRKERERNRMERKERARADERRRLTEEVTLQKHERTQKYKHQLRNDQQKLDDYAFADSLGNLSISLISSIIPVVILMFR